MNSYLILIYTTGGIIPTSNTMDDIQDWIEHEWFTYWWTYKANTEEEALALAETDFITDYTQPTIPLQLKAYRLYSIC